MVMVATTRSTLGRLEVGSLGAAIVGIPAILVALSIAFPTIGGGGGIPDHPPSLALAYLVLDSAPLFLVTGAVALSFAARALGVPGGAAAPILPDWWSGLAIVALAVIVAGVYLFGPLPLLILSLPLFVLVGEPFFMGHYTIWLSVWSSFVALGLLVVVILVRMHRGVARGEQGASDPRAITLAMLPCLVLPLALWSLIGLPAMTVVFLAPIMSLSIFGFALAVALRTDSTGDLARMRLAGRCMVLCAGELSFIVSFLGMASAC
jgi:hypothetical protein